MTNKNAKKLARRKRLERLYAHPRKRSAGSRSATTGHIEKFVTEKQRRMISARARIAAGLV